MAHSYHQSVVVDTVAGGASAPFSMTDKLCGRILIPSGANTAFTFYECETINGTYSLCSDVGTAGVLTVPSAASAPQSIALPSVLAGSRFLKIVAGTSKVTVVVVAKQY